MDIIATLSGLAYQFGLPGLFLAAVIVNATVFIVVPIVELAVVGLAAAQVYPPWMLGLAAGIGAGLGELTGYFVGSQGRNLVQHFSAKETGIMHRVQKMLSEHTWKGTLTVFVLASIPFPFDVIGVAAGLAKFPLPNFFVAATAGKTLRFMVLGYAALWGFTTIVNAFVHAA